MSIPQQRLYFRRLQLTDEKLRWLWEQCVRLKHRTMYEGADTPQALMMTLGLPNALHFDVVDPTTQQQIGIASLTNITDWSAQAHATYFDGRLRGREAATKAMMATMMTQLDLQVLHIYLPTTHRASIAWAERMGFTHDGTIRRSIRRNGQLLDHAVLSLLRETAVLPVQVDAGGNGNGAHGDTRRTDAIQPPNTATLAASGSDPVHSDALCAGLARPRPSRLRQLLGRWWAHAGVPASRTE